MTDSVTSEQHDAYEELAREVLPSVLWAALRLPCREPMRGYNASFKRNDVHQNLWWTLNTKDNTIEIDFLAHTNPLVGALQDVNQAAVADIPNVEVYKVAGPSAGEFPVNPQDLALLNSQKKIDSPEKPPGDNVVDDNVDSIQYIVAEITHGRGQKSVKGKLEQLEKDCFFLCSRANVPLMVAEDFRKGVVNVVALAIVVSPYVDAETVAGIIQNQKLIFPMLYTLRLAGRLLCVKFKRTLTVLVKDMGAILAEQRSDILSLREQNETLRGQLTEMQETQTQKMDEMQKTQTHKMDEMQKTQTHKMDQIMEMLLKMSNPPSAPAPLPPSTQSV